MNIQSICNTIKALLTSARTPAALVNPLLMVCSAINRPGLSTLSIAASIISKQSKAGVPFGAMSDGSANGYESMIAVIIEEIVNALKYEAQVETAIPIGGITFMGTGANAGGAMVVNGININFADTIGIMK